MEEEQRRNFFKLKSINQVRIQTSCDPPVTYIQGDMTIHEFDRAMMNISIGLSQDLFVERLKGDIWVSMTKNDMQKLKMKGTT